MAGKTETHTHPDTGTQQQDTHERHDDVEALTPNKPGRVHTRLTYFGAAEVNKAQAVALVDERLHADVSNFGRIQPNDDNLRRGLRQRRQRRVVDSDALPEVHGGQGGAAREEDRQRHPPQRPQVGFVGDGGGKGGVGGGGEQPAVVFRDGGDVQDFQPGAGVGDEGKGRL